MKHLIFLLFPFLVFGSTLPNIIEKVQHNDLLQSMQYITQAQEKALSAVKMAYLPKLTANAMYSYLDEAQRGLIDPEMSAGLEASFVLFDGFRRYHSIKAQDSQVQSSKEQEMHQRETLTYNTIQLYFNLLSLNANIDAKEQKKVQLEAEVVRLEKFFQAGSISEDKVEQIKAASAMTQYELALLRQNYQEIVLSLSTLTGETLQKPTMGHLIAPDFEQKGVTHELAASEYAVDVLKNQSKVKTADYWPSLILKDTFSATKYYAGGALPAGFTIDLPATTNKIQLMAQITLFDFFGKAQERASLLLQQKAKESELSYKKRDLDSKQKLAKTQIETSFKKITAAEQSFKSSEKSYAFIKERFAVNLVDSVTYLDALSSFYQSKALLAASKNDLEIAYAHYYYQFGTPLKEKIQ